MQEPSSGPGPEPGNQEKSPGELVPPAARGYLASFWQEAKTVLRHPQQFFDSMPTEGGWKEPLIFLSTCAGANAVLSGILSFNLLTMVMIFPATLVGCFLASLVANALAGAMGGKGTYESTFRVFAYSEAPMLIGWIPVIGMLGILYVWVLNYFGLRKVHELSEGKTVVVVLLSGLIAAFVLGLAACGIALRSILKF